MSPKTAALAAGISTFVGYAVVELIKDTGFATDKDKTTALFVLAGASAAAAYVTWMIVGQVT